MVTNLTSEFCGFFCRSEVLRPYPLGDEQTDGGEDDIDGGDERATKYLWEQNKKISQSVDNLSDRSEKS